MHQRSDRKRRKQDAEDANEIGFRVTQVATAEAPLEKPSGKNPAAVALGRLGGGGEGGQGAGGETECGRAEEDREPCRANPLGKAGLRLSLHLLDRSQLFLVYELICPRPIQKLVRPQDAPSTFLVVFSPLVPIPTLRGAEDGEGR